MVGPRRGHPPVSRDQRWIGLHRTADGRPDGYVSYSLEDGVLTVDETITADDVVQEVLDRFVLGHDLVREVVFPQAPTDHPLRWQLVDHDAVASSGDEPWLWVRVLDVPAALRARGWAGSGTLVLQVEDPFLEEVSRYELTVVDGSAECTRRRGNPTSSWTSATSGPCTSAVSRPGPGAAGRLRARNEEMVARAEEVFRTDRAPWSHHVF